MPERRSKNALAVKRGLFVKQYARRAHKGWDPNDRGYDRKIEEQMKRMAPEQLSELLNEENPVPFDRSRGDSKDK